MFLAVSDGNQTIDAVAKHYGISKNHLMKVAQRLVAGGFVHSVRGRGGGLKLAHAPDQLNLGAIVRAFEDVGSFVECFDPTTNSCVVTRACGLKPILAAAVNMFLRHLDQYSVADLVKDRAGFYQALRLV